MIYAKNFIFVILSIILSHYFKNNRKGLNDKPLTLTSQENFMAKTVTNKTRLYIVDPDRKGAARVNQRMRKTTKAKRLITPVSIWKFMLPA